MEREVKQSNESAKVLLRSAFSRNGETSLEGRRMDDE